MIKNVRLKSLDKGLIIVLVGYLIFSFFMITKYPQEQVEASWTMILPYTLVTEGKLAEPILKGRIDARGEHSLAPAIVQPVLLAGVYKIFGFGSLQSKALSIFAGFFLILLTYFFTKKYYDNTIALLAIIILASDNILFITSRMLRPDIFLALFGTAAFFILLHGLETKSLRAFAVSGSLMGISFYTHPNSFLILVAILIVFCWRYRLSVILSKEFWIFCLFCLIAFMPYAVYVIKEDYANNFSHFIAQLGDRAAALEGNYLKNYLAEWTRYRHYTYFPKRILIFLVQVGALVYAVLSKGKIDKYLAVFVFVFVFFIPAWNPGNPTARYFIVLIPSISILVSKLFIDLLRKFSVPEFNTLGTWEKRSRALVGAIIFFFLLNQIGGNVYLLWKHKDNHFDSFITEIKNTIPKGSKIWGSVAFWIGLYDDYRYITQLSPYAAIEEFQPDYAILYDSSVWAIESKSKILAKKMELLCSQRGTFIKRIENKFYGNIEIYKINWDANDFKR